MLKTKELTVLSSLTQSKGTWTDSDETNLPECGLQICIDTLFARTEHLTNTFLQHFTDYALYILQNKGVHDNGGGSGWSLKGKKKYDELKKSKPIGSNCLQHSTRSFSNLSVETEKGIWPGKWRYE